MFGGKLKSFDDSKVKAMRGVKRVVAGDDWVAVVADNWWRANQALKALPVEWDVGENGNVSSESIMAVPAHRHRCKGCAGGAQGRRSRTRHSPARPK